MTHIFLSHHHPDHTVNCALFPNAEIVDFWARYRDDLWLDHDGDGYRLSPRSQLWLTPGHTEEDASLIVEADDATYAMTHLWWHADRTPEHRSVRLGPGGRGAGPRARPGRGRHRHPGPRSAVPRPRLIEPGPGSAVRAPALRHDVEPHVVDQRLREPARPPVDEAVALARREPLEVAAQDHGSQERLERLAGLEARRLVGQPAFDVDEARRIEPRTVSSGVS